MSRLEYRAMALPDLPVALEMRAAMVRELNAGADPDAEYPGWRARYVDFYSSRLADGSAALYVAEEAGVALGTAAVYLLHNHRSEIFRRRSAYVTNVWVCPDARRRGIAAALMRMTVEWARARGCEVIRLRSSEMGKPLYRSLGFTATDEMEMRL